MTKETGMTNAESRRTGALIRHSGFGIFSAFGIRYSSFFLEENHEH
jgi:hypothetical protein